MVWPQNHWDSFSRFDLKTGGDGFSRFGLKTGGGGFSSLCLKIGNYGLVIWGSKSPRRFLGLGLKTKRTAICRLRHKIDARMKTVWNTCQDLVAYFTWKQVGLGFSSLPQNCWRHDGGLCTWYYRGGCVEFSYFIARSRQGLKMRPIFLKITEIRRDLPGLISEKSALFIRKISTVHQKNRYYLLKSRCKNQIQSPLIFSTPSNFWTRVWSTQWSPVPFPVPAPSE
jgi:hypothetical protein